ncbi:MAG: S26 family signal peptidase [Caldilineaceae bacterium]
MTETVLVVDPAFSPAPVAMEQVSFTAAVELWRIHTQQMPLLVSGHSMLPLLRPGDRLSIAAQTHYRIGDIVLFHWGTALVVHRIVAKVATSPSPLWRTQGDNCMEADVPVSAAAILGRVTTLHRGVRSYPLDTVGWRAAGWLVAAATRPPWAWRGRHLLLRLLARGIN